MRLFMCALTTCLCLILVLADETENKKIQNVSTELAQESQERILLFSTLDGTLTAIEKNTGKVLWKIKDMPIVQVPLDTSEAVVPIFLPDPRDGSLYLIGNSRQPLKKLPFTIPQLVSSSPCRSSDGILYTGKKKDTWYKLDPKTGNRQRVLGWDTSPTCPVDIDNFIYIGRTKYEILMVDTNNPDKKWNVTFYDYTSESMSKEEANNYDWVHFASTSSGKIITLDRRKGNIVWDGDLGSPIIATYILDKDGLVKIPFTSLANHTITYLALQISEHDGLADNPNRMKLYPTLYVGEHLYGLYAIPSLVDQNVVTITASDAGPLLLGGPHAPDLPKLYPEYPLPGKNYELPKEILNKGSDFQSLPNFGNTVIIYTGHYNVPAISPNKFIGPNVPPTNNNLKLIEDNSDKITNSNSNFPKIQPATASIGIQTGEDKSNLKIVLEQEPESPKHWIILQYKNVKYWINHQENKGLKLSLIIMTGCVIAMFWYLQMQVREMQNMSQNGSKSSQQNSSSRDSKVTAYSEELPNGLVKVGKITFHPDQLLGKGCEGTFVYRGEFDNRRVAVKRLLPECFTFADREVALLRETDAHPNVIRYYCMEQDRMFRYIALELCQATLSEYIQGKCDRMSITPLDILRQATAGLAHLHSLDIVHRDIKPHNVLISVPNNHGEVKVMISDFGLCKKLQVGRVSFSRRSGVTGTDGWIAPEMLNGKERTTAAVDLFSLGCLYYYVLSNGSHAFGDTLRRQANILMGEYDLSHLQDASWQINLQKPLISALISSNPSERPCCNAVLAHPIFWSSEKILSFFQDVSDRVEKSEADDRILHTLDRDAQYIVMLDWRLHIEEEVAKDLRKYRSYRGESVRDLLRALRNKKHHFRELTKDAQETLGEIPEDFIQYWNTRFPLLLTHTWIAMQCVAHETTFRNYYHDTYRFSVTDFKTQVRKFVEENPISLPSDFNLDHFEKKKPNDFIELDSMKNFNWSPNKRYQRVSIPDRAVVEGVGLYRNLTPTPQKKLYTVDVNDVQLRLQDNKDDFLLEANGTKDKKVSFPGNFGNEPEENRVYQRPTVRRDAFPLKRHGKKKKKVDEPLLWVIKDN